LEEHQVDVGQHSAMGDGHPQTATS
jgi:hypothetical protein